VRLTIRSSKSALSESPFGPSASIGIVWAMGNTQAHTTRMTMTSSLARIAREHTPILSEPQIKSAGERHKSEADTEQDREPDPQHGHPGLDGWREFSRPELWAAGCSVQHGESEQIGVSLFRRHPSLEHHAARARHGQSITVPCGRRRVASHLAVWAVVVDESLKVGQ